MFQWKGVGFWVMGGWSPVWMSILTSLVQPMSVFDLENMCGKRSHISQNLCLVSSVTSASCSSMQWCGSTLAGETKNAVSSSISGICSRIFVTSFFKIFSFCCGVGGIQFLNLGASISSIMSYTWANSTKFISSVSGTAYATMILAGIVNVCMLHKLVNGILILGLLMFSTFRSYMSGRYK